MRTRWLLAAAMAVALAACERAPTAADDTASARGPAADEPAAAPAGAAPRPPPADAMPPSADAAASAAPSTPEPSAVVPARFRGRYAADQAACGAATHETRLDIEADRIRFYESAGTIERAESDGDTLLVTATLTGEGQTRSARYRFRLSADGRRLTDVSDGDGLVRVRCE